MSDVLIIGNKNITIEEIVEFSNTDKKIKLSSDKEFRDKLLKSRKILEEKLENNETIYGVTTGYGDSCVVNIKKEHREKLPLQLIRYHQCGLGEPFDIHTTRAIVLARIISLAQGYSAIRIELLEHMIAIYNAGVVPRIPQEGSVGASGDLTPLSYYAAVLVGEGDAFYKGQLKRTEAIYNELKIKPIELAVKEGLALMNGTAVMTGVACQVYMQARYLSSLTSRITALASIGLLANPSHFHEDIFKAKPHHGTIEAAKMISDDLKNCIDDKKLERLQDRYSIRCAPHIIGVLLDGLNIFKDIIETELNSANDNPLIGINSSEVLHGGNFYGGHIAFAMDSLKVLIANIADLLDRQIALLIDTKFNNGLPRNLSAAEGEESCLYHGLKALQISSSAWTAEALKNSGPASVFSRSTECHNQDKVSMGTISSRDAQRILVLTNQVASAALITSIQAIDIRLNNDELSLNSLNEDIVKMKEMIRKEIPLVREDRPLEKNLKYIIDLINNKNTELIL